MGTTTMARVVGNDISPGPGSFEHFFRTQYSVLVRVAYNVLRDAHLAEDIAQEVLISTERRFREPYEPDHAAVGRRPGSSPCWPSPC